jgi:predicted patatin/cPLA2 family phospholipase
MSDYPTHRRALALQGGGSHGAFTWGVLDRHGSLIGPSIIKQKHEVQA